MATYAKGTSVPVDTRRKNVRRVLERFGTKEMLFYDNPRMVGIGFTLGKRQYRMPFPLPDPRDYTVRAYPQALREQWAGIELYLKSMLAAIELGFFPVEEVLMPFQLLPDGQTVSEWMEDQLLALDGSGAMPPLLPWGEKASAALALPAPGTR